ncbi:anti-lipopolysaccharide factor-like [Panulirus ornatus]|uniref:anti-lipopolysaccharide factor-like n=1 Tax=Panulirus ornatus TaxID=150431 RepID=UPI003A85BA60
MRTGMLLSASLVATLLVLSAPQCEAQYWEKLLPGLVEKLGNILFENTEFELLGHYCTFVMHPFFKKLELRYKGEVWCTGWTDIRGTADSSSRSGIANKTIRDFLSKAAARGVVTEAEVNEYLGNQ